MYADKITDSMRATIDATERRRAKQMAYNIEHGITPTQVGSASHNTLVSGYDADSDTKDISRVLADDPIISKMTPTEIRKAAEAEKQQMEDAAARLDFIEAARHRDEMNALYKLIDKR